MSNKQNNQAPKNLNDDDYNDYFTKYLDNKKLTFSKKLEKIEALKLKNKNQLQPAQIEMIEKKNVWIDKVAFWNKVKAHYFESIRKYKPELLDPSLGESEESKLRAELAEAKKQNEEAENKIKELESKLSEMTASSNQQNKQSAEVATKETAARVVRLINWVNCSSVFGEDNCSVKGVENDLKKVNSLVNKKFNVDEDVPEGFENEQVEALNELIQNENVWKELGGSCCSEGVWNACKKKYNERQEEENKRQEEENKRQEEEKKKQEEEKEKEKEEYNNFVDDESDENEEEEEEDLRETKDDDEEEDEQEEEETKEEVKKDEGDVFDMFFKKKETDWVKVESNKPQNQRGNRGNRRGNRGDYKKRNFKKNKNYNENESKEKNDNEDNLAENEKGGHPRKDNYRRGNRGYRGDRRGNRGERGERRGNRGYRRGNRGDRGDRRGNRGYRGDGRRSNRGRDRDSYTLKRNEENKKDDVQSKKVEENNSQNTE